MEEHRHPDDAFKKILENHPDFEPTQMDLDDMKKRLDEAEQPPGKVRPMGWWLPVLLLPLFLATGYLFIQNQKLNAALQQVNTQITEQQQVNTTIENQTTYVFDTIYRTTYIDKVVERDKRNSSANYFQTGEASALIYQLDKLRAFAFNPPNSLNNEEANAATFASRNSILTTGNNSFNGNNLGWTALQRFNFIEDQKQQSSDIAGSDESVFKPTEAVFIPTNFAYLPERTGKRKLFLDDLDTYFEYTKRRRSPMYHFRPKGLRVGADWSPLGVATFSGDQANVGISVYGVSAEVEFSDNFRFQTGARVSSVNYEEKDIANIGDFPTIAPDNPGDLFKEYKIEFIQLQIPLAFKYLWNRNKKIRPFASVGLVASLPLQQNFIAEYIGTSLAEYTKSANQREGEFSIKNIHGAFGMEYNIYKKLYADIGAYYLHDLELGTGEYFLARNLGLNVGLRYKL